jgi:ankyrin repeat protein
MKHLLLTTIAAVLLVGCGKSQQSTPSPEAKPEPPTSKAPDISIHEAASDGNIEAVKQHLAAGTDVNAKTKNGRTPLYNAAWGDKEIA